MVSTHEKNPPPPEETPPRLKTVPSAHRRDGRTASHRRVVGLRSAPDLTLFGRIHEHHVHNVDHVLGCGGVFGHERAKKTKTCRVDEHRTPGKMVQVGSNINTKGCSRNSTKLWTWHAQGPANSLSLIPACIQLKK